MCVALQPCVGRFTFTDFSKQRFRSFNRLTNVTLHRNSIKYLPKLSFKRNSIFFFKILSETIKLITPKVSLKFVHLLPSGTNKKLMNLAYTYYSFVIHLMNKIIK